MKLKVLLICVLILGTVVGVSAGDKPKKNVKFDTVQLTTFEIKDGVALPADFAAVMSEELVTQLTNTHKFDVLRPGETPKSADLRIVRLEGLVTKYDKGNQAARYLVGFGAGKTKIVAHIKLIDADSKVILERDVDGNVVMGLMGGESIGATRGLAKEVAKVTKDAQ